MPKFLMSSRLAVLAACALAAGAGVAAAGAPEPKPVKAQAASTAVAPLAGWVVEDGVPRYAPAEVTLPAAVAGQAHTQTVDFEPKGLNGASRYGLPGDRVWTTIYVYKPGVTDLTLLALQADAALRLRTDSEAGESVLVAAGPDGPTVARRLVYPASGDTVQGLLLARAGPWVIKVRATAPAARAAEVGPALEEALRGVRWDKAAFAPIVDAVVPDCPAEPERPPAKHAKLELEQTLAAMLAAGPLRERVDVPTDACQVPGTRTKDSLITIVHYRDPASGKRLRTMVMTGDTGEAMELTPTLEAKDGKPRIALGSSRVGGEYRLHWGYEDWPTDQQILDLFK